MQSGKVIEVKGLGFLRLGSLNSRFSGVLLAGLMTVLLPAQDLFLEPGARSVASLALEHRVARPGDTVWAGLRLVIPKPWHTYWVNHGGVGEAPSVKWDLPTGISAGEIHWPLPLKHPSFGSIAYVYEHEVMLLVPLKLSPDLEPGMKELKGEFKWLECTDEECVQGKARLEAELVVGGKLVKGSNSALFEKWRERLPEEMPPIEAEWSGEVAENFWRPLAFKVPVEDTEAKVEFFPYLDPKDEYMVQADVETERGDGFVRLVQQVESVEEKWPSEIRGVMRVGDAGHEVTLKVAAAEKNGGGFLLAPSLTFGGPKTSQLDLVLDVATAQRGGKVMAGVRFKIPDGWHVYYKDPGGPGLPPQFTWVLPKGVDAGEILWPKPEVFKFGGEDFNGYHGEVMLLTELKLAPDVPEGPLELRVNVEWQECKEICVQGEASLVAALLVADESEASGDAAEIARWHARAGGSRSPPSSVPNVGAKTEVTLVLEAEQATAGGTVLAGVRFRIPDKWHIFWKNPGDLGEAPGVKWNLPEGVTAGELEWPRHELYESMGFRQNVYHDEVMLVVPLTLAKDLKTGQLKLEARVSWQECEVSCVQGEANVEAVLHIGDERVASGDAGEIKSWRAKVPPPGSEYATVDWGRLGGMLLLAFAGGLILNLMPCVLPVIALKVMGFVNQREEAPSHARRMGILYGLGVVFSFLVMVGALLAVRAGAGGETWGMQMQNQWFLLFLTVLMTLVALNLFGVFEVTLGGAASAAAGEMAGREGNLGAFANGMLMVALATPCLAPMLGTAIGFALTQPALVVTLLFVTVALGLALPYVVLSFKPGWLRFLPKPGMWMESFKKAMGFPMLAAAVWLAWLTAGKLDDAGGLRVGLLLVLVGMAAWIYGEFIQRGTARRGLAWLGASGASAAAAACLFVFHDKLDWKPWSQAAVREAREAGHPVLVDFTADWCLTCKANKRTSIEVDAVREKIAATGTVVFKGDFTDKNAAMADFIKSHGRPGVPLVLVYSPNLESKAQILPELLTPGIVLKAIDVAAADRETEGAEDAGELTWAPWSEEAVAAARSAGKPVLVDFTADWCAPCKHIEKTAINVPKVRRKLAQLGAATLQADFTDKDEVILAEINRFQRAGPPLVLVYPPDESRDPIVMPKKFTAEELLSALTRSVAGGSAGNPGLENGVSAATASN